MASVKGRSVAIVLILLLIGATASALLFDVWGETGRTETALRLENVDISAEEVGPESLEAGVRARVSRPSEVANGSLEVLVRDAETGLLVEEKEVGVPVEGEAGASVLRTTISLDRSRDYDLSFRLLQDGVPRGSDRVSLRGLSGLRPPGSELKVELKGADFLVVGGDGDTTEAKALLYLESAGDYRDARLHVKAVQHESNLLADERWVDVSLNAGETERVEVPLSVPSGYNYVVEVEGWRGGTISGKWKDALNLNPSREVPGNLSVEKVPFRVEDFEQGEPTRTPVPTPPPSGGPLPGQAGSPGEGASAPGPGPLAALAALSLAGGVYGGMSRNE